MQSTITDFILLNNQTYLHEIDLLKNFILKNLRNVWHEPISKVLKHIANDYRKEFAKSGIYREEVNNIFNCAGEAVAERNIGLENSAYTRFAEGLKRTRYEQLITCLEEEEFYRCRHKYKDKLNEQYIPFTPIEMYHRPLEKSHWTSMQRYNSTGTVAFYLSCSIEGCISEMTRLKSTLPESFSIGKFRINKALPSPRILDLSHFFRLSPWHNDYQQKETDLFCSVWPVILLSSLRFDYPENDPPLLNQSYLFSNLLFQHLRSEIDDSVIGIKYRSVQALDNNEDLTSDKWDNIVFFVSESFATEVSPSLANLIHFDSFVRN